MDLGSTCHNGVKALVFQSHSSHEWRRPRSLIHGEQLILIGGITDRGLYLNDTGFWRYMKLGYKLMSRTRLLLSTRHRPFKIPREERSYIWEVRVMVDSCLVRIGSTMESAGSYCLQRTFTHLKRVGFGLSWDSHRGVMYDLGGYSGGRSDLAYWEFNV